jgi:hypothetical protein
MGIRQIAGDIVLDRSAFEVPDADPATFDGEPLRPYNAAPDALLINFKAVVMTFAPERSGNTAQVQFDPPLAGVQMQASVPLSSGDCGDYRGALKADFSEARHIRFGGSYAASCGEKVWPVAYADPRSYGVRAVQGMWLDMGGKLGVLIAVSATTPEAASSKSLVEFADNTAMQIAAMSPLVVSKESIAAADLAKQKEIFEAQMREEQAAGTLKAPEASWPKIIEGKVAKWFNEVTLVGQESVTQPGSTVDKVREELGKQLGADVKIDGFLRFAVGEGIEKKTDDLAAEVAKLTGG